MRLAFGFWRSAFIAPPTADSEQTTDSFRRSADSRPPRSVPHASSASIRLAPCTQPLASRKLLKGAQQILADDGFG